MDRGVRRAGAATKQDVGAGDSFIPKHGEATDRPGLGARVPNASMPCDLPMVRGLSPGVVLVPGVGASFLGVGVLDFRLGVDDLSF